MLEQKKVAKWLAWPKKVGYSLLFHFEILEAFRIDRSPRSYFEEWFQPT